MNASEASTNAGEAGTNIAAGDTNASEAGTNIAAGDTNAGDLSRRSAAKTEAGTNSRAAAQREPILLQKNCIPLPDHSSSLRGRPRSDHRKSPGNGRKG